jgi:type III restriction enzyme
MNIELKDFQESSVQSLLKALINARREAADGTPQAIALNSPTGSGKTITVAALMERILDGDENVEGATANAQASFLWFSHDPELNKQSRDKLLRVSTRFGEHRLIAIDNSFKDAELSPGHIYFINTQKLSKTSGLTSKGDGRLKTIWEVLNDTARNHPLDFILVIDEAHRGMTVDAVREATEAVTIVQKFIKGADEISPIKLILGISATPARFEHLIGTTTRTKRTVSVDPVEVINSGLLKDTIIISHTKDARTDEFGLLEQSIRKWQEFTNSWDLYCTIQGIQPIRPILVIQVEDATASSSSPSRTDLGKVVQVLERVLGRNLEEREIAHSFQDDKPITISDKLRIRKLDASSIQDDPDVRFVLFKMSLTTGWDCPRAEVMMSFRAAADHTLIAQLVGRMVRTPLARRIENSEMLNSVSLYLPRYDDAQLNNVVRALQDPENQTSIAIELESELEMLRLDDSKEKLKKLAEGLPSYGVESIRKTTAIKRLMKLARGITYHEIDTEQYEKARAFVIDLLKDELNKLRDTDQFKAQTIQSGEIEIAEVIVENGTFSRSAGRPVKLEISPESIERLFRSSGTLLGEGLHIAYWKATTASNMADSIAVKLQLSVLIRSEGVLGRMESACAKEFDRLRSLYKEKIRSLPSSKRLFYTTIAPRPKMIEDSQYPSTIPSRGAPRAGKTFRNAPFAATGHLYVNDDGKVWVYPQSGWETYVVKKFTENVATVGWLRNLPKKSWSLSIPYDKGSASAPLFPDYIVFVKRGDAVFPSIVDPHNEAYEGSEKRAIGIARYAEHHGDQFHQILLVTKEGDEYRAIDVNRTDVRERIYKAQSRSDIAEIRKDLGFAY